MASDSGGAGSGASNGKVLGTGTTLQREANRVILSAGTGDVVFINQVQDALHLIVNGGDTHSLTAAESRNLEIRGNRAGVYADRAVTIPIKGLQSVAAKPSAGAGARLAKARQRSSAFGAVLAQQLITADFKKDKFLVRVAEQFQKLAGYFSLQLPRATSPSTAVDLLPQMVEMTRTLEFQAICSPPVERPAATQQAREPLIDLYRGLALSLQNAVQQMRAGTAPDMEAIASQMTELIARLLYEGKAAPAPGKIPPEARSLFQGVEVRKFFETSDAWNAAITGGDIEKSCAVAMDTMSTMIGLREEKAALVRQLCEGGRASNDSEMKRRARAVNAVLASSGSPDEFKAMLESAGKEQVARLMRAAGEQPEDEEGLTVPRELADFNVTAGALGCSLFASDPSQAKLAEQARSAGFSAAQILRARRQLYDGGWSAENQEMDLETMAESALHMTVSTVVEKAAMIRELNEGRSNKRANRAVVAILESAQDAAEFGEILKLAGPDAVSKLEDPEAKRKLSVLAGAYNRIDLAPDADAARSTLRILMDADACRRLAGSPPSAAAVSEVPPVPQDEAVFQEIRAGVEKLAVIADRRTIVNAILGNAEREKNKKPIVNAQTARSSVDKILRDPEIPEKARKTQLEEWIRKQDLSEPFARSLLLPLTCIYMDAVLETEERTARLLGTLRDRLGRLKTRYGAYDSRAISGGREISELESSTESFVFRLRQAIKCIEDVLPAPRDGFARSPRLGSNSS